jgi:hypothetical protein
MAEVPTGEANKVGVSCCAVDSFGADGAAMMTTQAGGILNAFLNERRAPLDIQAQCKRHEYNRVGHSILVSYPPATTVLL